MITSVTAFSEFRFIA